MATSATKQQAKPAPNLPAPLLQWATSQLQGMPAEIHAWGSVATSAYLSLRECLGSHMRRTKKRPSSIAVLYLRMRLVTSDQAAANAVKLADPTTLSNHTISAAKANAHLNAETLAALRVLDVNESSIKTVLSGEL